MMKKILLTLLILCLPATYTAWSQESGHLELDTLVVPKPKLNNYWMAGVYGGAAVNLGFFNPTRTTTPQWSYPVAGFSVIRYFTMFGLYPYMGFEFGGQLNYEGYEFQFNDEFGYRPVEPASGAYKLVMKVPEAYALSHFHIDAGEYFKVMAKLGIYAGYRMDIHRTLDDAYAANPAYTQYIDSFMDHERRWTYGVQGGVGFGVVFSPIEIHINAQAKWGWESFWTPDYTSPYYYRFAYPLDGAITIGVYYQLSPRYGRTRSELKKLARKMVQEEMNGQ